MKRLLLLTLFIALCSCSDSQKETVKKTAEDATGATAIKQGQEMKASIDSINEIQQKRLKEIEEYSQ